MKDVLELPWGFEIFSLLTRWNPLNLRRPYPKAASGKRVLIVGMGPAGFTLAHYLMNDGHTVVGIDGLKIEPLPARLSGVDADGTHVAFEPVRDVSALYESLDDRLMAGFGGVAEYGITVRWDKNFLKLVRLLLERRREFALIGGVRFGGTLSTDDAFAPVHAGGLGFDHLALAAGAGRPTILDMPNGLARGVRTASDFLMALQLTGAAKGDSIANMQLRLPVVVIGGGLTAIDTATESLAYYPLQVEKFLRRYEVLVSEHGEQAVRATWDDEERRIADEFVAHAQAIRGERAAAAAAGRAPRILELLHAWGGVTIAYRRRLIDSPSYTLNHEEVEKALEEGIVFAEGLTPTRIDVDQHGHVRAVGFKVAERGESGEWQEKGSVELAARSLLVAAGTQPNTVAGARGPGELPPRRQVFPGLRRGRKSAQAGTGERQARTGASAAFQARGRALHQLLRRFASVLLWQCGEGDGQRQAGLPDRQPRAGAVRARLKRDCCGVPGAHQRRATRQRGARRPPHAHHRRGGGARAAGGAALPARPVLSTSEFRHPCARRSTARVWRWKGWR